MLRLSAPDAVRDLLFPDDATGAARIRQLAALLYGLPAAAVRDVARVDVVAAEFQRPLFPPRLLAGTWTRNVPDHARTEVRYEGREAAAAPEWVDLSARLAVDLVLELDGARVESIVLGDIGEFETLAQFEAKFRYFDLAGYMDRHRLTTVDDLKRAYRHLLGEIRLAAPPPFDPDDPANRRRVHVDLAVLIRDTVDVTAALRSARLVTDLMSRTVAYRRDVGDLEAQAVVAPVLVLPAPAIAAGGISEPDLLAFFAAQDVLAIPLPP